jgi:hypothetical protein
VTGIAATDITSLGVMGDVLHVGTAQTGAAKLHRVLLGQYGSTGQVVSPLLDLGLPGQVKTLRSVSIVTSALTSPQSVQVEYQLEDTGAWTSLGALSSVGATGATWNFPGTVTAKQVGFRVTLAGSAGATTSPVLYELTLRYVPRPGVTREWELALRLEGTAELPLVTLDGEACPQTGAQLTTALWTAAGVNGTLAFVDLDGTSYQVYLAEIEEEVAQVSQRRGWQRTGLVKLVEAA